MGLASLSGPRARNRQADPAWAHRRSDEPAHAAACPKARAPWRWPRNEGRSTAPPARPAPRRGIRRDPASRAVRLEDGARAHPRQQAEDATPCGARSVRPFPMETRPRGPLHDPPHEAASRQPSRVTEPAPRWEPTPGPFPAGRRALRYHPECRGSLVPMNQGDPHGSEEPGRLRRPRVRPKAPACRPDCR